MTGLKSGVILPLVVLLCSTLHGFAQNTADQQARERFYAESGVFSTLYTGKSPAMYPHYAYDGTPFLYSPEFLQSDLVYDGKFYKNVLLNLNAHKDLLYVLSSDPQSPQQMVELSPSLVQSFTLKGTKFIYYTPTTSPTILFPGYYAVLHDGAHQLLRHTTKRYQEHIDQVETRIVRSFLPVQTYYLMMNGLPYRLTGQRSLLKLMHTHRKEIRKLIRDRHLNFTQQPDHAYSACVAHYESLIK